MRERTSQFTLDLAAGGIDFHRDDGIQRGRYVVNGDQLTLRLANVGQPQPPPEIGSLLSPRNTLDYVFEREQ